MLIVLVFCHPCHHDRCGHVSASEMTFLPRVGEIVNLIEFLPEEFPIDMEAEIRDLAISDNEWIVDSIVHGNGGVKIMLR